MLQIVLHRNVTDVVVS